MSSASNSFEIFGIMRGMGHKVSIVVIEEKDEENIVTKGNCDSTLSV